MQWGPLVLGALSCLSLVSCAAGTYPVSLSRRPLGMPAGEHRFVLALGTQKPGGGLAGDGTYAYGITDHLQLELPLIFTYGGPVADNLELRGRFGWAGFGFGGSQTSRYYGVDPRYDRAGGENFYTFWVGSLLGRTTLGPLAALVFGLDTSIFIGAHVYKPGVVARGALVLDVGPRLSASLGLGSGLSTESPFGTEGRQVGYVILGSTGGALDARPTVAIHVFDQLDLVGYLAWSKGFERTEGVLRGTAGIDWHFD